MNVLYVVNQLSPAGAEKLVSLLSNYINSGQVYIYAVRKNSDEKSRTAFLNLCSPNAVIRESQYSSGKGLNAFVYNVRELLSLVEEFSIDIIHSHCEYPDICSLPLKGRVKALIRTAHNERYSLNQKLRLPIEKFFAHWFDSNICISKKILENHPVKNRAFITNAIDMKEFSNTGNEKNNSVINVAIIGRITKQKNQIAWANNILKNGNESLFSGIRFNFFGDGEHRNDLEMLVADSSLFKVHGFMANVDDIYGNIDVVLIPSLWEGISTVMLEALCRGIPLVTADVSGAQDVQSLLEHSIICDINDLVTLSTAIRNAKKPKASELQCLREYFSVARFIPEHQNLYSRYVNE